MTWWQRLFYGFNTTQEEEKEVVPTFTDKLTSKGFQYNETQEWWQRTWTTPIVDGVETCLEVYKQNTDDTWNAIMYGTDGGVFYEHNVGEKE